MPVNWENSSTLRPSSRQFGQRNVIQQVELGTLLDPRGGLPVFSRRGSQHTWRSLVGRRG